MSRRRFTWLVALLAAFALVAAACGGDEEEVAPEEEASPTEEATEEAGGTFRVEMEGLVMDGNFDPTTEFVSYWNMVFTNVFLRPLMNYKHIEGDAGLELVPDLAADFPEISDDGLTYTFTLRDGVMFGPPVNREVTSQDVAYAFQRMASLQQGNQYTYYFDVVDGFEVQEKAPLDIAISGIETPDDKTFRLTLAQPTPDILFRLAMPATAPIPQEVADCFQEAGAYGRVAISSSSYMFEGSENLDITSCDTVAETTELVTGFQPEESMDLVRNPNYDPATDSTEVRENLPDRFEIRVNTNVQDIFNKIEAGELESSPDDPPAQFLRKYAEDRERLPTNLVDVTWYITLNMTQPPFDDVHVRKAANLALDKEGLLRAAGGPLMGTIATHILPPVMGGFTPEEYTPYPFDVDAAKAEMEQSKYDTDGDGVCDAPECKNILHLSRNEAPWTEFNPIIEDNMAAIGLELKTRELEGGAAYDTLFETSNNIPIGSNAGWGKDWPDPVTFFEALFTSPAIQPGGANTNPGLVGITPEINEERKLGIEGNLENVPSVDEEFEACNVIDLGQERLDCFNALDQQLMDDIVPWIPYRWDQEVHLLSPSLVQWAFDQNAGEMAFAHIAIDPSLQA